MSKFKNTKFRVGTLEESRTVEKAMFTLGFCWSNKQPGEKRVPLAYITSNGWIYVDKNCRMTFSGDAYGNSHSSHVIGFKDTLYAEAAAFKATKTAERRKHRKSQAMKRAGWLPNTGVKVEEAREVVFRDGTTVTRATMCPAGDWTIPYGPVPGRTVEWYKLPEAKPQVAVTQADMVASIVKDAGGKEVDADGYIVWAGGACPVAKGTLVDVKYRDGQQYSRLPAKIDHTTPRDANNAFWINDGANNDIVAYRVSGMAVGSLSAIGSKVGTFATSGSVLADKITIDRDGNVKGAGVALPDRSNPKDAMGDKKPPLALCSPIAKAQWAVCQYVGLVKYGAWNWRIAGVRSSVYLSAMQRHMDAYNSGEEFDPVDGTPHLGHIMACAAILIDAKAAGKLNDDRPPSVGIRAAYAEVEAQMAKAVTNYGHMLPQHYTIKDTQ